MRLFFAKEGRGELPKGKALEWAHETKSLEKLPERKNMQREYAEKELQKR